ncbi:MAG: inositol phosphorylceramide synthase, partial [Bacteroidales bacterium]|nr:inositol phosphorylceramide synthase [Bacteroidales bacterium]
MEFKRFTKKNILINLIIVFSYMIWMSIVGDLKQDHYILVSIWLVAFYIHDKSRRFILGFSIFILFWIIYDSMRIIPNYEVSTPHIQEPYDIEKALFGISYLGEILTPNELFLLVNNSFLDFISGIFYINWMPIPLGFGVYLYLKNKELFVKYSLAFLFVNLLGFTVYYIYPAAAPWYVQQYGFEFQIGVPGS